MPRTGRPKAVLELTVAEREQLQRWARRRKSAQALALRSRIVLACATGLSNKEVAAAQMVSAPTVGKWRARFVELRVDGLDDDPRPGRPASITAEQVEDVVVTTLESTPKNATHWSRASMAERTGLSRSSIGRIWRAFELKPHRAEGAGVEKAATAAGTPAAEVIGQRDRLLRHLAATTTVPPTLDAVEVDQQTVTLHLAEPVDLPAPWHGAGTVWTAALDSPVGDADQLPPYPLLASVGQGDDGHLWLLDLEHLGSVNLTGDPDHAQGLARHLAAELALSPWAVITEIDTSTSHPNSLLSTPGDFATTQQTTPSSSTDSTRSSTRHNRTAPVSPSRSAPCSSQVHTVAR